MQVLGIQIFGLHAVSQEYLLVGEELVQQL